jgi:hypothetical protein
MRPSWVLAVSVSAVLPTKASSESKRDLWSCPGLGITVSPVTCSWTFKRLAWFVRVSEFSFNLFKMLTNSLIIEKASITFSSCALTLE